MMRGVTPPLGWAGQDRKTEYKSINDALAIMASLIDCADVAVYPAPDGGFIVEVNDGDNEATAD